MTEQEFIDQIAKPMYEAYKTALGWYFKCAFCESHPKFDATQFTYQLDEMGVLRWCVTDFKGAHRNKDEKDYVRPGEMLYMPTPDLIPGWMMFRMSVVGEEGTRPVRRLVCPICYEGLKKDNPELFTDPKNP